MKVICAGLQKTGTKSLAKAMRILGYNVHDVFEQFMFDRELWYKVLDNTATKDDFEKYLTDVDVVTDLPGNIFWEDLLEVFPDAKVVLSVRSSEDEWYRSFRNQAKVHSARFPKWCMGLIVTILRFLMPIRYEMMKFSAKFIQGGLGVPNLAGQPTESILRSRYRQYNTYVKSACPKDKLLVYSVEEGWQPLCEFLKVEVPNEPFPKENVGGSIVREIQDGRFKNDGGYRKLFLSQAKRRGIIIISTLVVSLAYTLFLKH